MFNVQHNCTHWTHCMQWYTILPALHGCTYCTHCKHYTLYILYVMYTLHSCTQCRQLYILYSLHTTVSTVHTKLHIVVVNRLYKQVYMCAGQLITVSRTLFLPRKMSFVTSRIYWDRTEHTQIKHKLFFLVAETKRLPFKIGLIKF